MPKSFRIYPVDQPAVMARSLLGLRSCALAVFNFDEVEREFKEFRNTLDIASKPKGSFFLTEKDWDDVIRELRDYLGPAAGCELPWPFYRLENTDEAAELYERSARVLRAIDYARRSVDQDGLATGLLLPVAYAERICNLLSSTALPIAWVRLIDKKAI